MKTSESFTKEMIFEGMCKMSTMHLVDGMHAMQ